MDIDVFVSYINSTQQSVARGIKHFGLSMRSAIMTKAIKEKGYTYDSRKKEWVMDIVHTTSHGFTLGEKDKKNVVTIGIDSNPKEIERKSIHTISHDVNSPQFTQNEIESIRIMLKEWKRNDDKPNDLASRIEAIPKDEKVRKTIVISKSVGERLDEFCKVNRVQKSSVLELAIVDFINRSK